MLPFDRRPWAKTLATVVIAVSLSVAITATYMLYSFGELHIPEVTIALLLLLTILPPNVQIVMRKPQNGAPEDQARTPVQKLHTP